MAFFLTRYLGQAFGKIYGVSFAFFTIGNTLGGLIGTLSFDHLHSYAPAFYVFAGCLVVACVQFLMLGTYAYPAGSQAPVARTGQQRNARLAAARRQLLLIAARLGGLPDQDRANHARR